MITKRLKLLFSRNEIIAVTGFFVFVLSLLLFTFFSPNYYKMEGPVKIDIKKGMTLNAVIDTLYNKKIIGSKTNMKIAAFMYGAERNIKAGRYIIPNGLSYLQLIEFLLKGDLEKEVLVTIPEGSWQTQVAEIFHRTLGLDSARIMELSRSKSFIHSLDLDVQNLEGYLLPESYYFYPNSTEEEVLRKLKNEADKFFTPEIEARIKEMKMSRSKILTLASIIEGESNKVSEFKTISAVYHNRLKRGMLLQADPTVQYLIRDRRKNKIYYKDLDIDSKFNTYKYTGLPPAPINNPGKDAIMAALYPEKNNFLYFVADGQGGHVYSANYSEHSNNVSKYREWRRKQN